MEIMSGIVIRSTGSWYLVHTENGQSFNCRLPGKFRMKGLKTTNPLTVGDKVNFIISGNDTNIIEVHNRTNCIIRKATNLSKQTHLIAANIDQQIIIATIAFPRTSTGFIDRLLVCAEAYHIPSIIVFNKTDLYNAELQETLNNLSKIYKHCGYQVITVSALKGTNIEMLKSCLYAKTSLLSGHSGVGKSHLINAISPELNLRTGQISKYHLKGKHTTTFAEMYTTTDKITLIDTPGIKEFGLVDFEPWELGHWFPEFSKYIPECRFSNCTHLNEPGCAVKNAVEDNEISATRYKNYLGILQNIEDEL